MTKFYSEQISFMPRGKGRKHERYYFIFKEEGPLYISSLLDLPKTIPIEKMNRIFTTIRNKFVSSHFLSEEEAAMIHTLSLSKEEASALNIIRWSGTRYRLTIHQSIAHKFNFKPVDHEFNARNLKNLMKYHGIQSSLEPMEMEALTGVSQLGEQREALNSQPMSLPFFSGLETPLLVNDRGNLSSPPWEVLPDSIRYSSGFFNRSSSLSSYQEMPEKQLEEREEEKGKEGFFPTTRRLTYK